jgi:hypothetical protein
MFAMAVGWLRHHGLAVNAENVERALDSGDFALIVVGDDHIRASTSPEMLAAIDAGLQDLGFLLTGGPVFTRGDLPKLGFLGSRVVRANVSGAFSAVMVPDLQRWLASLCWKKTTNVGNEEWMRGVVRGWSPILSKMPIYGTILEALGRSFCDLDQPANIRSEPDIQSWIDPDAAHKPHKFLSAKKQVSLGPFTCGDLAKAVGATSTAELLRIDANLRRQLADYRGGPALVVNPEIEELIGRVSHYQ